MNGSLISPESTSGFPETGLQRRQQLLLAGEYEQSRRWAAGPSDFASSFVTSDVTTLEGFGSGPSGLG